MKKMIISTVAGAVAFVEPLVTAVRIALAGAVIGWTLGIGSK